MNQIKIYNNLLNFKSKNFNTDLNSTLIPFEKWSSSHFSNINQQQIERNNITSYLCPKLSDVQLLGNLYSSYMKYISIKISKWNGTTSSGVPCKMQYEINDYIDTYSPKIIVSQSYYDFDDYKDPIKHYIDTKMLFKLISEFTIESNIYVQENHAEQRDSIFQFQPSAIENSFIKYIIEYLVSIKMKYSVSTEKWKSRYD